MPSSPSSSLYIIGASSASAPLHADPIRARAPDGGDTDDDAVSGGALSRTVAERFASSFRTQDSIDSLCRKYGVPEQFTAILPAAGHHRACSPPPPGAICVYAQALEAGMRIPLHGFFCEVLAHFGVAPSQVVPNGWRVMAGFVVLSHFACVSRPSLAVFRHFFSLCAHKLKGRYWFRGKDSAGALVNGLPHSLKGWKEEFFFLRSQTPWPCPVKWGEPSRGSTAEPVLTKEEKGIASKLLRAHGAAVDLKTYLSESNLAAAMITGTPVPMPPSPPPRSPRTASSAKGMDPSVYDTMKSLRAAKAAQASREKAKVVVKSEPGSDATLSGKKRKPEEDATKQGPSRHDPSTPLDHAHGSCSPAPPGFSTQKTSSSIRDHDPVPKARHMPADLPDGDTVGWEAARQTLQSVVSPSRERAFSAAEPSDVIQSSYVTMLQAANCVSFSLGYALELEEKLAAREREAEALRQELAQAKARLAEAEKASEGEARSAREAAVKEYLGSTQHVLRLAQHALAGYERGMDDMKRAALRRYPHLDPEQLVVPPDGGGPR
ncbi:unnamed protein product [Urochloa humidicola]